MTNWSPITLELLGGCLMATDRHTVNQLATDELMKRAADKIGRLEDENNRLRAIVTGRSTPNCIPMSVERFTVAEYIADELDARGWSVETFAAESGITQRYAEELLAGKIRLTKLMAKCVADALGLSKETWLRLQAAADAAGGV